MLIAATTTTSLHVGLVEHAFEPIGTTFFNIGRRQHFNTSQCIDAGAGTADNTEDQIDLAGIDSEKRVNKLSAKPIDTGDHKVCFLPQIRVALPPPPAWRQNCTIHLLVCTCT